CREDARSHLVQVDRCRDRLRAKLFCQAPRHLEPHLVPGDRRALLSLNRASFSLVVPESPAEPISDHAGMLCVRGNWRASMSARECVRTLLWHVNPSLSHAFAHRFPLFWRPPGVLLQSGSDEAPGLLQAPVRHAAREPAPDPPKRPVARAAFL